MAVWVTEPPGHVTVLVHVTDAPGGTSSESGKKPAASTTYPSVGERASVADQGRDTKAPTRGPSPGFAFVQYETKSPPKPTGAVADPLKDASIPVCVGGRTGEVGGLKVGVP